ncbi:MAG TPA: AI-2E family transporter [Pirellulales bacterium]|jgi:predicted PurR-regulated permease PerM|nr:AI-2E family transporter [Pirellulales bacterium]
MARARKTAGRRQPLVNRVVQVLGLTLLAVSVWLAAWYSVRVLLLIFAGVLLAVFLRGLSLRLKRFVPVPEGVALALVVSSLLIVFCLVIWFMEARVAEQVEELAQYLPKSLKELEGMLRQTRWGQAVLQALKHAPAKLENPQDLMVRATGAFTQAADVLVNLVLIMFIGLYGAYEPQSYLRGMIRLVPPKRRNQAADVFDALGATLWDWLMGRLVAMAAVFVLDALGLWALGVPLALTLGLISGLLTFVPNFGPLVAAVPALLVALLQYPMLAVYVCILHFGIMTLEGYFITPLVQQRMMSFPAILVIGSQVIFAALLGPLGLVLATPLAASMMVLIELVYLRDILGEPAAEVDPREIKQQKQSG